MKLRIPGKHRRNQDQHQFNAMQYAEHERAPIPVPRVRILSRIINSRSCLLPVLKNGPTC